MDMTGTASPPSDLTVEQWKIREFVRAAGITPPPVPLAPLGFSRASVFQEPEETPASRWLGVPLARLRHAGHEWRATAPLRSGRTYRVSGWRPAGERTTTGRTGGPLRFVNFERELTEPDGDPVLHEQMTLAVLPDPPSPPGGQPGRGDPTVAGEHWHPDWWAAAAGTLLATVPRPPFTLTDFVRFAGAIGDFTAIHHDRDAARRAGLAEPIAMGMLPGAILLDVAARGLGVDRIVRYGLRFLAPLHAGEPFAVRAVAGTGGADVRRVELTLHAKGTGDRPVLRGFAEAS